MTATLMPWLKFMACAVLIGFAGSALTRYGDIIPGKLRHRLRAIGNPIRQIQ